MEAHPGAELLPQVAHFRAAQQHVERPAHAAALSGEHVIHHGLLLGRHFVVGERLETVTHQPQVVFRHFRLRADDAGRDHTNTKK